MTKRQASQRIQRNLDKTRQIGESVYMEVSPRNRIRRLRLFGAFILVGSLSLLDGYASTGVSAQEHEGEAVRSAEASPSIGVRADRILREMSDYLKAARQFSFQADIVYDAVRLNGQKIQYGGTSFVSVRRPGKLHVEYKGDERQTQAIFNGRTFTVHDVAGKVYTVTEVPSEIDSAIDKIFEEYGVSVPVADLVYSDPYSTLTERVESGYYVGTHKVGERPSYHLSFTQDIIDWQIWIDAGPRPVPRKLLITYKEEPGSPQYSATFSRWDFQPRHSDHYFEFRPPAGADRIEFLPAGN